jgi:hypothetical protein
MSSADTAMRVIDERNRLISLVEAAHRLDVTDTSFDFTTDEGEFTYEVDGHCFQVTVRELAE